MQNLRYALRQLRKSPGFTLTAVLTLALGIGATTAIFSTVYGLLLKSLPFQDAARIVAIAETNPKVAAGTEATYPDYQDWAAQQKSFSQTAAYSTINPDTVSVIHEGHADQLHRVLASGNFFSLLGVTPLAGRTLTAQDDTAANNHVAVISAVAWQRYFDRDPNTIGRAVDINGATFTIIGILPPGAAYPADGEVWLPLSLLDPATQASRVWHSVNVLGRLRPGVELASAKADMQTVAARLSAAYPATNRNEGASVSLLRERLIGTLRPALLSLLGAVVLVLLIACSNVANLLMVRAAAGRREVAVRQALGAGRSHLFSQFLAQSLVLCLLGGAFGILLAYLALPLLRLALAHTAALDPSMIQAISLNIPVLLFALSICTLTAVVFGLLPILKTSTNFTDALRPGDRSSTSGSNLGRGTLIAGQIAVTVVVLFLSTLVIRSFQKLIAIDPGFRTDHLFSAEITLPKPQYADGAPTTLAFYKQLLDKISQAPGVVSAGTTNIVPLKPSQNMTRFLIEGAPPLAPGTFPFAQFRFVSPSFFSTMGLSLRQGRLFEDKDMESQTGFFIVNQAFADQYLSGRNPLNANILLGVMSKSPVKIPVVGVVSNAHDLGIESDPQPELYLPGFNTHGALMVRSAIDPQNMAAIVRNAVHSLNPNQPIYNIQTYDTMLSDSLARQRMTATLLGIFAAIALILAAIGIYGVLAYSITQRTREIGVRMAVGANRSDIVTLVLSQAGGFVLTGIAVGLAAALTGARLIDGLLFHTSTVDPVSIATTIAVLAAIAALAITIPARRAASVNPTEALRAE